MADLAIAHSVPMRPRRVPATMHRLADALPRFGHATVTSPALRESLPPRASPRSIARSRCVPRAKHLAGEFAPFAYGSQSISFRAFARLRTRSSLQRARAWPGQSQGEPFGVVGRDNVKPTRIFSRPGGDEGSQKATTRVARMLEYSSGHEICSQAFVLDFETTGHIISCGVRTCRDPTSANSC